MVQPQCMFKTVVETRTRCIVLIGNGTQIQRLLESLGSKQPLALPQVQTLLALSVEIVDRPESQQWCHKYLK